MALVKLIASALFIGAIFSTPAFADPCVGISEFADNIKQTAPVIMLADREAAHKIIAAYNDYQKQKGAATVDGTAVLIAMARNGEDISVGLVIFDQNQCAVKDTVVVVSLQAFAKFIANIGVTPDNFHELQGS